eukprot:TRINITY_DN12772_c0_g1_i1.p1 TRINITY_DN12772_c0_g1~~TRINITY_DN12772_c0_g1_i1.p1  ORF type:complete len:456 (+),score=59.69 TRINITY_DN12772_c0_g1_i1:227-1594(+)
MPDKKKRQRVSIACLGCTGTHRKCSGQHPCDRCEKQDLICVFPPATQRKRRGPRPRVELKEEGCMTTVPDPVATHRFIPLTFIDQSSNSILMEEWGKHLRIQFYAIEIPNVIQHDEERFLMMTLVTNTLFIVHNVTKANIFMKESQVLLAKDCMKSSIVVGFGVLLLSHFLESLTWMRPGSQKQEKDVVSALVRKGYSMVQTLVSTQEGSISTLYHRTKELSIMRALCVHCTSKMLLHASPQDRGYWAKKLMSIPMYTTERWYILLYCVYHNIVEDGCQILSDLSFEIQIEKKYASKAITLPKWNQESSTWVFPIPFYNFYEFGALINCAFHASKMGHPKEDVICTLKQAGEHLMTQDHSQLSVFRLYFSILNLGTKLCLCYGLRDIAEVFCNALKIHKCAPWYTEVLHDLAELFKKEISYPEYKVERPSLGVCFLRKTTPAIPISSPIDSHGRN